jgi:hypothetical protein
MFPVIRPSEEGVGGGFITELIFPFLFGIKKGRINPAFFFVFKIYVK